MIKRGITKRFAEVGKIKVGGKGEKRKSKDGKEYQIPVRFESFVVTTTEKGPDGNFMIDHALMKKIMDWNGGDKEPKEIPIRLPFDSVDMNFFTSFQYYAGAKCICRGDGEKAQRIGQDGIEKTVNCNPDTCEFLQGEKCKVSGILSCHIPLAMEAGAVYRFRTHSWNSVSSVLASLEYISENTNGVLQNLPLKLKFLKKATQEHGNVNIVTVVLDGIEMMKMRELAFIEYENRMKLGLDMKLLENKARESGFLDDTDDPADVQDEFYTPTIQDAETVPEKGTSAADAAAALKTEKPTVTSDAGQGNLL